MYRMLKVNTDYYGVDIDLIIRVNGNHVQVRTVSRDFINGILFAYYLHCPIVQIDFWEFLQGKTID